MKFTLCIAALVSVAMAVTHEEHQGRPSLHRRLFFLSLLLFRFTNNPDFIKRQTNVQNSVDANTPAMTDKNGNVVAFDTAGVYLDSAAKGL